MMGIHPREDDVAAEQLKLALSEALELTKALRPACKAIDGVLKALETSDKEPLGQLTKKVAALERTAEQEGLKRSVVALGTALVETKRALAGIERDRRDVLKRRQAIALLAAERGFRFKHGDRSDWLGPFRVDHTEQTAVIKLARFAVARLRSPSGLEAVLAAEASRSKLEKEARRGWDEFVAAAYRRQETLSPSEPVAWAALVDAAIPDPKVRRRNAPVITYRLALLVFGGAPDGWAFTCVPPTLAEQRNAVEVPDPQHPGESVRVSRGRLRRP
jgi:hypothetical protein